MKFDNEVIIDKFNSQELLDLNERVLQILEKRSPLDAYIKELCDSLLEESHYNMNGKFGYRILDDYNIEINRDHIKLSDEKIFNCSNIISSQLRGSEGLVIFVSTLGNEYDDWLKSLFNSNEPLKGYIADLIGSVAVECGADILEEKINKFFSKFSIGCSNRYSPGYCNWNVIEQKKIFDLLPSNFCGIELTQSSLMVPIKSVSGIIGYGKSLEKREYACKICTQEDCYMNKLRSD